MCGQNECMILILDRSVCRSECRHIGHERDEPGRNCHLTVGCHAGEFARLCCAGEVSGVRESTENNDLGDIARNDLQ